MSDSDYPVDAGLLAGDWGALPQEPCRYCHRPGKVRFLIDDSPWGKTQPHVTTCGWCNRTWTADSPLA
jgi:hypothetical protein